MKDTEFDKALFGNWNQILDRVRTEESRQDLSNQDQPQPEQNVHPSNENGESNTEERQDESGPNQLTQEHEPTEPAPVPADFALPESDELICELIEKMTTCGMTHADAKANIEKEEEVLPASTQKNISRQAKRPKVKDHQSGGKIV